MWSRHVEFQIEEVQVKTNSPLANKTIAESKIKQKTGATIIAIRRGKDIITNPPASETIFPGDLLIVIGTSKSLHNLEGLTID